MSTFQLNVKGITEAQSEIKYVILNLNEIQQKLESQISRLDVCFNCDSNYEVKKRLAFVSANQICRISDNLSDLAGTLDDISESVGNFEQKAVSIDTDINKVFEFFKNMSVPDDNDLFKINKDIFKNVASFHGILADVMKKMNGTLNLKFDSKLIKQFEKIGMVGDAISVIELCQSAWSDFERLNSDGEMSNRDYVKLKGDVLIDTGAEWVGEYVSKQTAIAVAGAVAYCSGGTLAGCAPFVGAACGVGVSIVYDKLIKDTLVGVTKNVYEKTVDFVGDGFINFIDENLNNNMKAVEFMSDTANTLVNDFGDNVQDALSDFGHATFGDFYDNIDNSIDKAQEVITEGLNIVEEGYHKVNNAVSNVVKSIFS